MSEGKLEQFGSPTDIYERPATRFVAEFVGQANLVENVNVILDGGRAKMIELPGAGRLAVPRVSGDYGNGSMAMIRPHQLEVRPVARPGDIPAKVRSSVYFGDTVQYEVEAGANLLKVQMFADGAPALPAGSDAAIGTSTDCVHFIAA
ncbi:TOBE domain-containing protein [Zafaria sp. J156]|nr:TOBE domain-containing protein [Zafaria sp. J156]MEE1622956.1 TOBE domain-containing protein [Zafaria sp. J156]